MTNHHAPFQSLTHLPHDLAIALYLATGALITIGWEHTRPWIAQRLTAWGQRLA